jgi:hypothetical protein
MLSAVMLIFSIKPIMLSVAVKSTKLAVVMLSVLAVALNDILECLALPIVQKKNFFNIYV